MLSDCAPSGCAGGGTGEISTWEMLIRSGRAQRGAVLTWILLAVLAGVIVIIILIQVVSLQPPTLPPKI